MDSRIRVGITSIGSGVGQSIINSCKLSDMVFYTIGLGASPMAFGAFDCNVQDSLPNIYSSNYIEELLQQCKKHEIQVLIPGLDDELYDISKNLNRFMNIGTIAVVSSSEVIELCRDKVRMSKVLNEISNVFVESYDKDSLLEEYKNKKIRFPLIAKPRSGFASNGLLLIKSAEDFEYLNDLHVIQELAIPHHNDINYSNYIHNLEKGNLIQVSEISAHIVIGKNGNIIGKCATYNKLKNGVPIEIIPYEDNNLWDSLEDILKHLISIGLRGPINIQGRMTNEGYRFFEMNARFTGITGLRALMGFNEVEAIIKDYLEIEPYIKKLELNTKRVGIRQVTDRVVEHGKSIELDNLIVKTGLKSWGNVGRTVLVTGATGFLGKEIVRLLDTRNDIDKIICLVRNIAKAKELLSSFKKVTIITADNVSNGNYSFGSVDVLIHTAFGRTHDGSKAVTDGLIFTNWILNMACIYHTPEVINISSQAVYGLNRKPLWQEGLVPLPETPYAQAKLASELMVSNISKYNKQISSTSIRLSAIFGPGLRDSELSYKLSRSVINNEDIIIRGGKQNFDLLDVRDAAAGIISLLDINPNTWRDVYNLGSGSPLNIKELAELLNHAATSLSMGGSRIIVEPEDINLDIGMDITRICRDTGWRPVIKPIDTFIDTINWFTKLGIK